MSIDTHNAQRFAPGDTIVLCREGGVFRATINPPSSGVEGAPITYDGRGQAVISGADLVTGWTQDSGSVWRASLAKQPQQVFIDGDFGRRRGSRDGLETGGDWYWDGGTQILYLWDGSGNPDNRHSPGIEAGRRGNGIAVSAAQYVTITGVTARQSNQYGLMSWASSYISVQRCIFEWNWLDGCIFNSDRGYSHITVEDSEGRYNGCNGISFTLSAGTSSHHLIRRNRCYENGRFQALVYERMHTWTGGIKVVGSGGTTDVVVEENEVFSNGHSGGSSGNGIWFDYAPATSAAAANIVRHNLVYDNQMNGIFIESSSHCHVWGNVLYENAKNGDQGVFTNSGIRIDARESTQSNDNLIYNNTIVGGRQGIFITTYNQGAGCSVSNNVFKNNIIVGSEGPALRAALGGDNDGVRGSGNVYQHNCFGAERRVLISWRGGDTFATYSGWERAADGASGNINGDPGLVGPGPLALYPGASSPCIDAGENLGPAFAAALRPGSAWPSSVETADQDADGRGWEVGAYLSGAGTAPAVATPES